MNLIDLYGKIPGIGSPWELCDIDFWVIDLVADAMDYDDWVSAGEPTWDTARPVGWSDFRLNNSQQAIL